ncbi:MAG: tRNA (adenosine(37)-N6)-threonylcarbamoyltransferase complex transferase subunit TsaD [Candidatus Omnitrophica bacterium]|nr:tRNA (adenosine(37)-N6)-threonylcarbamoyltransferase complex transferase subunit TsaD [Candidatus Omnitrophota bacterium]
MNILGIETSCDETAAAVVTDGVHVCSNVVASSLKDHAIFGGIIPEIASRRQIESIHGVVFESLTQAKVTLADIDAIAVTTRPGLMGSLLVGISFARALAYGAKKPLIEIDHIQAHWYANFLRRPQDADPLPELPAVGLVVSGGHTSLFDIKDFTKVKLLGATRDDAAGEAFDKVARLLNLGYPGGPIIDRLAKTGVNKQIRFPKADLEGSYDFSFSGLKTAVLYYTKKNSDYAVEQVAYSFQDSVVSVLTGKAIKACQRKKAKTLLVGGGVAANSYLREHLVKAGENNGIRVCFPPLTFCLDNAAMIAGLAYRQAGLPTGRQVWGID